MRNLSPNRTRRNPELFAVVILLAAGCGAVEGNDSDATVVAVVDGGTLDAPIVTTADARVFDADPGAPDAEPPPPDAMPNFGFDIVYGSEVESNTGNTGSGLFTSSYLRIINTGEVPLDLADLEFLSTSSNAPAGTQALIKCTPSPNSVVLQPGESAGNLQTAVESLVVPLASENSVSGHNVCSVELKFFNSTGWVTFGVTGRLRIGGKSASFTIGFVEKSGNLVKWIDATRTTAN